MRVSKMYYINQRGQCDLIKKVALGPTLPLFLQIFWSSSFNSNLGLCVCVCYVFHYSPLDWDSACHNPYNQIIFYCFSLMLHGFPSCCLPFTIQHIFLKDLCDGIGSFWLVTVFILEFYFIILAFFAIMLSTLL